MATPSIDKLVTELRNATTTLWNAHNAAEVLVEEYNARGLSGAISAEDIDGENYDVTPQNVADLIGSVAAIQTLMGTGHATNFARCIKR